MLTRKQAEKFVRQYSEQKKLEHTLHYGRIHGDEPRKFWYLKPFGGYSFKVGDTLNDVENWLIEVDQKRKAKRF